MAQRPKSTKFGLWVRTSRLRLGRSQESLAQEVELDQQVWSRIERGMIPSDAELARICKALGEREEVARRIIMDTATTQTRVQLLREDFLGWKDTIRQRALSATPEDPLEIFVLREDSEATDDITIQQYAELLSPADEQPPHIRISLLFRFSDRTIWQSFRGLATKLAQRWVTEGRSLKLLQDSVHGYYRCPDSEEDRSSSLPMPHALALIDDMTDGPQLYSFDFHPGVYDMLIRSGRDSADAKLSSAALLPGSTDRAKLIDGWIGSHFRGKLDPDLWTRISWPDLSELSTKPASG